MRKFDEKIWTEVKLQSYEDSIEKYPSHEYKVTYGVFSFVSGEKKIEFEVEYTRYLWHRPIDMHIREEEKTPFEHSDWIVSADEKVVSRNRLNINDAKWLRTLEKVKQKDGAETNLIYGGEVAIRNTEIAEAYIEFIEKVIEAGYNDDARQYDANKRTEKVAQDIADAKDLIARAKKQADIPTYAEVRRRQKAWNDLQNEGGEGFIPNWISRESYENAKKFLKENGQ